MAVLPTNPRFRIGGAPALSGLEQGLKVRELPVEIVRDHACNSDKTIDDYIRHSRPDILVMSGRTRWGSIADRLLGYETYVMLSL